MNFGVGLKLTGIGSSHSLEAALDQGVYFELEPPEKFPRLKNKAPDLTLYVSPPGHYK